MDLALEILFGYCQAFVGFFYPSKNRQTAVLQYLIGLLAILSLILLVIGIILIIYWPQAGAQYYLLSGIILLVPAAIGGYLIELSLGKEKTLTESGKVTEEEKAQNEAANVE